MTINDLKHGDILLFGTDHSPLDALICALLKSKVAHAALYIDDHLLADAASGGINRHRVDDANGDPKGREVFVRRLNTPQPLSPVLNTADRFLGEDNRYDWAGLLLVGLIILYRDVSAPSLTQKLLTVLFRKIAADLDRWINEHAGEWTHGLFNPGPHPMFCSEFVFRCFQDAGAPYHLEIRQGDLLLAANAAHAGTLLDRILSQPSAPARAPRALNTATEPQVSTDELASQLLASLNRRDSAALAKAPAIEPELVAAVDALGQVLKRYTQTGKPQKPGTGLQHLSDQRAFFVTPNDLLCHCVNVTDAGTLTLLRDKKEWKAQP